jgi:hypothetical protein
VCVAPLSCALDLRLLLHHVRCIHSFPRLIITNHRYFRPLRFELMDTATCLHLSLPLIRRCTRKTKTFDLKTCLPCSICCLITKPNLPHFCFVQSSTYVAATGSEPTGAFPLFPSDRPHLSFWSGYSSPSITQLLPPIFQDSIDACRHPPVHLLHPADYADRTEGSFRREWRYSTVILQQ